MKFNTLSVDIFTAFFSKYEPNLFMKMATVKYFVLAMEKK